jgi:uncharacterized RDD family membrane protein YckC
MTQQGDMTSQQPAPGQAGGSPDLTAPASSGAPAGMTTAPPAPGQSAAGQPAAEAAGPAGQATGEAAGPAGQATGEAAGPAGQPASEAAGPAGQATPHWPSPYLAEGQAVPEAYPAPARPGQPRYGDAVGSLQAPARFARPGYGQPRAAAAQADVAGPAATGQDAIPAEVADLPLASAWERLLAMTMDWLVILAASFLLLHEQMAQLLHRFQHLVGTAQTLGPDAQATALTNFVRDPATISAEISYWLLAVLMALAYFWALQANGGATLGKRLLGLRVVRAADRSPAGAWVSGVRTILFLIGPSLVVFSAPRNYVPLVAAVGVLGAVLWIADSLVAATDPQKRALHDRLAGTIVVRKAPRRGTS